MNLTVGFTGTQLGLTEHQRRTVVRLLELFGDEYVDFVHGDEAHSDTEAAGFAQQLGYRTVARPGPDPDRRGDHPSDVTWPPRPFLDRNRDIVRDSDVLIACPSQNYEVLRSGTWATVRYARKAGMPVFIVKPNGELIG